MEKDLKTKILSNLDLLLLVIIFTVLFVFVKVKSEIVGKYLDLYAYINGDGCKAVKKSSDVYEVDCSEYKRIKKTNTPPFNFTNFTI